MTVLLALLAPQGTLLLLRTEPRLDVVLRSATIHLIVVSAISACALAVAVAAAVVAAGIVLIAVGTVHWWRWRLGFDRIQLAPVVACLLGAGHGCRSRRCAVAPVVVGPPRLPADRLRRRHVRGRGRLPPQPHAARRRQGWHPRPCPEQARRPHRRGARLDRAASGGRLGDRQPGPSLRDALEVIRQHHERFDGSGYPDGLAGEQISLAARIVAVVDVWDALTSDRAYRAAWPADRVLRHLEAGRGTQFDPDCLNAFLALMAERGHRPGPGEIDPAVADAAAEACHDQPHGALGRDPTRLMPEMSLAPR